MEAMQRTPWEPVPGREGIEIHARVKMPELPKGNPNGNCIPCGGKGVEKAKHIKKGRREIWTDSGMSRARGRKSRSSGEKPHGILQEADGRRDGASE